MLIDLDNYPFNEWIKFVFDHPVSQPEWYFSEDLEWSGKPELILKNAIQLFKDPTFLISRYSPEQVEQGLWFLLGPEGKLCDWLWDPTVSWILRQECILTMVSVFERLFTNNPFGQICYMWWDLLRSFDENPDRRVLNAMFKALCKILKIESRECQMSALHGLGHLPLRKKEQVIEDFLDKHPDIDTKMKSHALAAIQGKML